jgi:hypothetical protein
LIIDKSKVRAWFLRVEDLEDCKNCKACRLVERLGDYICCLDFMVPSVLGLPDINKACPLRTEELWPGYYACTEEELEKRKIIL